MILMKSDFYLVKEALKSYIKKFNKRSMTHHSLTDLIEHFEELENQP